MPGRYSPPVLVGNTRCPRTCMVAGKPRSRAPPSDPVISTDTPVATDAEVKAVLTEQLSIDSKSQALSFEKKCLPVGVVCVGAGKRI